MKLTMYEAPDVWVVFQQNKEELRNGMRMIAENPEYGVTVHITAERRGKDYLPDIIVYMDDDEVYSEAVVNEHDCTHTVQRIYDEYLDDEAIVNRMIEENRNELAELRQQEDDIEQREGELFDAASDMLDIFLNEKLDRIVGYQEADEIVEDVMDHICEYLFREHGLSVYRPMVLEDDDGEEFFEEFPYDCMEFDD